jgi:hypothetical protein
MAIPPRVGGVMCTQDARLCSDGSYVARTGPNCEFAPCPTAEGDADAVALQTGIMGVVVLGPTCPVMRDPPDPACADQPYATSLVVLSKDGARTIKNFASALDGSFTVYLSPGEYLIGSAPDEGMLPRCSSDVFTITSGMFAFVQVSCDTGIR